LGLELTEAATMTYGTRIEGEGCVLQISGDLDALSVPEIRAALDQLVADGHTKVVIEVSELKLIDSSGVGAIVSLFKRVRAKGGSVIVRGLREQPLAIFRLLKLDRVMTPDAPSVAA
jgi:anti-sigma B factor antagonist